MMEYIFPKTRVVFGNCSFDELGNLSEKYPGNVMLFTGKYAMKKSGFTDRAAEMLSGRKVTIYDKVEPSPQIENVMGALEIAIKEDVKLIIALGGGSVIDTAKCVAALATNFEDSRNLRDYADNESMLPEKSIPFIAIPTTSGTGAEVTRWAVVWDGKKKHTISGRYMYAREAILDPLLTYNLPKKQTASTGMDALSQSIESYWSKNHNRISDNFALKSIKLVFENLRGAYEEPDNSGYRKGMMLAALYSGYAINGTKTTACHSISYPISSYFKVPHGHACALTIPSFLVYNHKSVPERIDDISMLVGANDVKSAAENIRSLMKNIGLETKLGDLGIDDKGIDIIIENGFTPDRVKYNPRNLNTQDLKRILEEIK